MKTKTRDLSACLKRRLWIAGVCLAAFSFLSVSVVYAADDIQTIQQQKKGMTIKGKVLGTDGEPIIGASVLVKGSTTGVVTDLDGNYTLANVSKGAILEFSYVGYVKLTKTVGSETTINAILYEDSQMLEGVEVVAFGTQKKESVIGAISTVKVAELKTPSSNLTNALAGRIAGVISYQRTGEPGVDDASFFVRGVTTFGYKKDPLILIDGIELTSTDLARLQPDDIASFSIMKDATATALYGARGANGVILVKTKEGQKGKARLSLRVENSISTPTQEIELADPVTYMRLHNEAYLTRNPLAPLMYSEEKIDNTVPGAGSVIYPATDWRKELLKDFTMNQRVNLNITGGGDVARYYVAASYSQDNGILEVDKNSNFNNNIKQRVYTLRSNVNINATKTTELIVRLSGVFDDYNGPLYGGSAMYNLIMKSNPVLFPAKYPKDEAHAYTKHTLFGNAENGQYLNPYAEMVRGYKESGRSNLSAQFEVKQDLKFLTEGLSARLLFNTSRISSYDVSRKLNPYYYKMTNYDYLTGDYAIDIINPDEGSEYLIYDPGGKSITANMYIEAALNYNRDFGKHGVELSKLNNIIEARAEEIIANVWNQIQISGYEDKLLAGIILTGGAANLKNLEEMLRRRSKIEKMRMAKLPRNTVHAPSNILKKDGSQNTLFGLLFEGNQNCCLIETAPQIPVTPATPRPEPEIHKTVDIFEDDQELKEQARLARLKKEEEEKEARAAAKEAERLRKQKEKEEKERRKREAGPSWIQRKIDSLTKEIFSDDDMK